MRSTDRANVVIAQTQCKNGNLFMQTYFIFLPTSTYFKISIAYEDSHYRTLTQNQMLHSKN